MLLRHTTADQPERKVLSVNPAKTCQPVGAMYAALGIHGCLPHSHGSQGCCAYHRSTLTRHYKEPVMAATSSFTEGASVFGGQANLLQAIDNIFTIYDPQVIAVHTTCLSETIGDDLNQIVTKANSEGKIPEGKFVIHASTPSYKGSHVNGFATMTESMVKQLAQQTKFQESRVNVIPGFVEPADMAEIKRLVTEMKLEHIMFPDTSGVLNGPQDGKFRMYPEGGTSVYELMETGDSSATIALGTLASGPAAKFLDRKFKIPCHILDLPIGIAATDRFIDTLRKVGGVSIPESILLERGQMLDIMTDMQQYFYKKRVAIIGDPDQVFALTEFVVSLDMVPAYIVTGTPAGKKFDAKIAEVTEGIPGVKYKSGAGADMHQIHSWMKQEPVDLILGNTYMKYVARDENTPLVRHGFPIVDRIGHSYFPTVGYKGGMRLMEKILDVLMDKQDRSAPEESFELVM